MQKTKRNTATLERLRTDSDPSLIELCIDGDSAAWDAFFTDLQPKLLRSVRYILGGQARDHNLVEEIVGRVWLTLIDQRYRSLRQFDESREVKISTYLVAIARYEWLQYRRSELRRQKREYMFALAGRKVADVNHSTLSQHCGDFREILTPRERDYWDHLIGEDSSRNGPSVSATNGWKLRERIRKKLEKFAPEFTSK